MSRLKRLIKGAHKRRVKGGQKNPTDISLQKETHEKFKNILLYPRISK